MDRELNEKKLRVAIVGLQTSEGHLRDLGFDSLADQLNQILEKCNEELMNLVPDAVPGLLMEKGEEDS
jgi:hypothetical protein